MNKKQQNNKDTFHSIFNIYTFLLIIAILFNFFIRLRISDMPLERDEGEFGYIAQMILDGESPFSIYNFKIPGVSYVYALFMLIFGQTVTAIRMSLIFFNIITIIFLYLLSKKLFSPL